MDTDNGVDTNSNDAEDTRTHPPFLAGEFGTLIGFVDYLRQTIEWKTRGLDIDQLRTTLPPSTMTLGGMLAHLSFVEDFWVSLAMTGTMPEPWDSTDWDANPDADWDLVGTSDAAALRGLWETSVDRSRTIVNDLVAADGEESALATIFSVWGGQEQVSLRWILVHLVEEYGRHAGHADLLREAIDGFTGD